MGLDCSHDAWSGAYSAFNRLKQAVCKAAGGRHPHFSDEDVAFLKKELNVAAPDEGRWYVPDDVTREKWPGLYAFLEHSDCDGHLTPEQCAQVADDLTRIAPLVEDGPGGGHVERNGGFRACVKAFAAGCRRAAEANENLLYR